MQLEHDDGEIEARRSIVRTMNRDPFDVWTRDSLARTLGLSSAMTARVLGDLVSSGLILRMPGDEYTVAGTEN